MKKLLTVIVACYNEEEALPYFYKEICKIAKKMKDDYVSVEHIMLAIFENANREIKELFLLFSKWLRKNYVFPIHLNIYIVDKEKVKLKNNQLVYGRFRYYENRTPVIHIPAKIEQYVKDSYEINEIFDGVLSSLVHELTHYYQFVLDLELSERQANYYRFRIVDKFNFDRRD